jgi:hypothetical protein
MHRYVIIYTSPRIATRKGGVYLTTDAAALEHARSAMTDAPEDHGTITANVYRNRGWRGLDLIGTVKREVTE